MRRVTDSGADIHDVISCLFSNSAFSTDGVYRPILGSQYISSRWWPLLRRPIIVCSFLHNFYSSLRPSFSPFMPYTQRIATWQISPSGGTPNGGLRSHSCVGRLLDWLQLVFGLVHLPPHSPLPCSGMDTR